MSLRSSLLVWTGTATAVLVCLTTAPGNAWNLAGIVALAVFSRIAAGNLAIFFLVTGLIALKGSDLTGESLLAALVLPLYVMVAAVYLLCFLIVLAPGLGSHTGGTGGSGLGGGDSGGGGGGGC